jgi:hypothetical protein
MIGILLATLAIAIPAVTPDAPGRQAHLAWGNGKAEVAFGSGQSIYIAESSDGGRSFGEPHLVAKLSSLMLGRHRGPRAVVDGRTVVVTAVGSRKPGVENDLLSWRSEDGGRTWAGPTVINDIAGAAREGLHAMAADGKGHLAVVWLDLRHKGTELAMATSGNGGKTWSKNVTLYRSPGGTICQCCGPSIATIGADHFAVMFRNAADGARDLYTFTVKNGALESAPEKLGKGTWHLEACPMDGGGVAVRDGHTTSAWRREKTVYLADPGRPETPVAEGKDVALALGKDGAYVAWTDGRRVVVREPGQAEPVTLSENGGFADLVATQDGTVLAAWEESGGIRVQRLDH